MDLPNLQQQNGMLLLTKYGEGDENYSTIKFETELIKPFLCDYSDAYILVAGNTTARNGNADTKVAFKNLRDV